MFIFHSNNITLVTSVGGLPALDVVQQWPPNILSLNSVLTIPTIVFSPLVVLMEGFQPLTVRNH